ncbi:MAG: Vi polysaccharide biosynthesis UDP-N-acetylglucosamine C-6 dehydrogenase TviB [Chromatiales bacterium]|jgi:UDP-N-acetyl-D-glucosamine/UDP-N-acetyl-D-galactosamine dehydrogenase|nr:Vi polysaccharide biosynthesis UDP-N-acetylglucosamine C-6 dehydrogenase TviB [Chromatiales bacterium]
MRSLKDTRIAVLGLGYVGLPLAVEFSKHFETIGFDIDSDRVAALKTGNDKTLEVSDAELAAAEKLSFFDDIESLKSCNVYIITVPTPIDAANRPDITALRRASEAVGSVLIKGDVVIYESTVYPGATEEDCVPILESVSGLTFNEDFFAGYSPERINPGDKEHRLPEIMKVTSGSTPEAAEYVDSLYAAIITAGTHKASSIRVAEAAKVIENTQRDVNIALINELSLIFNRMGIDTLEVLEAAGTKWNFLNFRPGLVGGHCIGVDPYYLTHKSQEVGYHPEMILAGRRINDNMGIYVATQVVRLMVTQGISMPAAKILIMGMTFKENCPDVRNTRIVDLVHEFASFGATIDVYDPWADPAVVEHEYNLKLTTELPANGQYDAVVMAVAHDEFRAMTAEQIHGLCRDVHVVYDIKYVLDQNAIDGRL